MLNKRFILFLPFLLIFFSGCIKLVDVPIIGKQSSSNSLLNQAKDAYNKGDYQKAADKYSEFFKYTPNPPEAENILTNYALASEKAGDINQALKAYNRLLKEYPKSVQANDAALKMPSLYLSAGYYNEAEQSALKLLKNNFPSEKEGELKLIIANSQWMSGNNYEAFNNYLDISHSYQGSIKDRAIKGVEATLTRLDTNSLKEIQKKYGHNFPAPEASYLLVYLAAKNQQRNKAIEEAAYFDNLPESKYKAETELILEDLEKNDLPTLNLNQNIDYSALKPLTYQNSAVTANNTEQITKPKNIPSGLVVGAVLPLSSNQNYGQEVLNGLKLAFNEYQKLTGTKISILSFDSQNKADLATAYISELGANKNVIAAVGPIASKETLAAAQTAQANSLPLIAISQRPDLLKQDSTYIFRIFLTPKHQSQAIANYAVKILGHNKIAILYPEDGYGRAFKNYFAQDVTNAGGELVQAESYNNKTYQEAVNKLVGGNSQKRANASYQKNVAFNALLIPDTPSALNQLVPSIAFNDLTKIKYLGSSLWLSSEVSLPFRYIQGALVPTAISLESQNPVTKNFINAYQNTYKMPPDQFAAYGYDAGLAIIEGLKSGANNRKDLVTKLKSGKIAIQGSTGYFTFSSEGEYLIDPTILMIKDSKFELIK